jgi:hypothetical protein
MAWGGACAHCGLQPAGVGVRRVEGRYVGYAFGRRRACSRAPDIYSGGDPKGGAAPKKSMQWGAWGAI